jgi:hypothetical protein
MAEGNAVFLTDVVKQTDAASIQITVRDDMVTGAKISIIAVIAAIPLEKASASLPFSELPPRSPAVLWSDF